MVSTSKKNKKIKLKKKNLIIFIIILILGSIILYKTTSFAITSISNLFNKETKTAEQIELEKKLKKLDNIDEELKYFNYNNIDRYITYKEEHKDLSLEDIITQVNIGLDNDFYVNSTETTYLNKKYILVNKYNELSENYVPKNLVELDTNYARSNMYLVDYAKEAFEKMAADAKSQDLTIKAMSAYRDYTYQKNLYNKYVSSDGQEKADTYSARPGYSEHQTGLALDIYNGTDDYNQFATTKEYEWMQQNAHKYGFILRYPENKEYITGYTYESWHYRYVGTEIATYIYENNITFEEYYVQFIEN